ncbi:MAG: aromatic ring-hydroxylating dioxygenase subunit alpha [Candidatus Binatus sp.]|uniref:aromatic ring-hydroxylating oxygenase subunit alpha n=1 Tax=Candidatus Binatus sp. TaxID=2811406 RepID=UPI003C769A02
MASNVYADASIASALERGDTLPANWYIDSQIFDYEKDRIFHRTWQYVGHTGRVSTAGDFFTTNLGDLPVVVVRDTSGAIRAFANVCRHRGSEVVLECAGNRKTLQCHYHGWTYNLDGTLRTAPRENEQDTFAKETLALAPFAVETWGPLIFVNPAPTAGPLRDVLGELPAIFERAGINFTRMRMLRRDVYEIASNWKIVVENFNECYHCPIAHPKFSEVIDTNAYRVDTDHEYFSTYYGPILGSPGNGVNYATLWPNVLFSLYGNPPNLQAISVVPIDAGHTRQVVDYFFAADASEAQIRNDVEFSDLVTREDIVLCESVQRGLRSGAIEHGKLMLSRERGIQHFQKLVYRFLSAE